MRHCEKSFSSYLMKCVIKCMAVLSHFAKAGPFFIPVFLKCQLKIPRCLLMHVPRSHSLEF